MGIVVLSTCKNANKARENIERVVRILQRSFPTCSFFREKYSKLKKRNKPSLITEIDYARNLMRVELLFRQLRVTVLTKLLS